MVVYPAERIKMPSRHFIRAGYLGESWSNRSMMIVRSSP